MKQRALVTDYAWEKLPIFLKIFQLLEKM